MSAFMSWAMSPEWVGAVKALLHTLWQATAIAFALAMVFRRVINPAARYRCAIGALAAVLVTGLVTWASLTRAPRPLLSPALSSVGSVTESIDLEQPASSTIAGAATPRESSRRATWTAWLALAWVTGAALMLMRAGFQVAGAEQLRRSTKPLSDARVTPLLAEAQRALRLTRKIRLAVTDKLTSPAVVGILVPTLILPLSLVTTLTPEQLRFVLLHELAHIRRGDYLANLFQLFVEALLFFNPAVWWISHQVRREREACCDALAIQLSGAPADYARTLVHVAENMLQPLPAAVPAFGDRREPSSLVDRVQRLLVPGYRPALRLTWRAMLAALFVAGVLLFLSAAATRVTVAAILSPQQRIEEIAKKMTEYGKKPVVEENIREAAGRVLVTARIRTSDGSPVIKAKRNVVLIHCKSRGGSGLHAASLDTNGMASDTVAAGRIWIEADIEGYAPTVVGPFDGTKTNRLDVGEVVVGRGFELNLQLSDAASGATVTNAALRAQFMVPDSGFHLQRREDVKPDAVGRVTLSKCVDQRLVVTANAPGYEVFSQSFDSLGAGRTLDVKLRRGAVFAGRVVDKATGQPIAGAIVRIVHEKGPTEQRYGWDNPMRVLAQTDAAGRFTITQLRAGSKYWLGVSAPGHESTIIEGVSAGSAAPIVKLGPELVVRGRVLGNIDRLQKSGKHRALHYSSFEVVENSSYGDGQWLPLHVSDGVATFQFTNRTAGEVTLSGVGYRETRTVTVPVNDWVIDLDAPPPSAMLLAENAPKREVIFRFKHPSGVPPRGTVAVSVPYDLDPKNLSSHTEEKEIKDGEVRVSIAIGGRTSVEPRRMVGYWFSESGERNRLSNLTVTNGVGPMIVEIPVIPAGAIYAMARISDGSPADRLYFGIEELKPAPGRSEGGTLRQNESYSNETPRKWVSGPLPLGGTYQVYVSRDFSFCASKPITLTDAKPDAEVELQFSPGKTFNGIVLDPDGKPLRDAEVKTSFALRNHSFGFKSLFTDDAGRFRLDNTTPEVGEYSVEVSAPGARAECVKLDFKSSPQLIRLKAGQVLAGRVVQTGTGFAIPGMEVRAADFELFKLPMQTTRTDANGRFRFNSLGPVKYAFFVDGGQIIGPHEFRAGDTNVTLSVKLYEWSKLQPKADR
jgi:beta-lactamase regulating signal transducer with metallopeptidase domain